MALSIAIYLVREYERREGIVSRCKTLQPDEQAHGSLQAS